MTLQPSTALFTPQPAPAPPPSERAATVRRLAFCLTIAATFPYLVLKIMWICGSSVGGMATHGPHAKALLILNVLTFGMDIAAVGVDLTFYRNWGWHRPGWLVLFPMWIATGLLTPIALAVPSALLLDALTGVSAGGSGPGELQAWVFEVIYGGFILQGIGLGIGFVFYARTRWPSIFLPRTADGEPGPTQVLQVLGARVATALLALAAAVHLFWAFGGTAGQADGNAHDYSQNMNDASTTVLAVITAIGILMMVRRRGNAPLWLPSVLTWVGAGAMFAWGMWPLTISLMAHLATAHHEPGLTLVMELVQALAGMLVAMVALIRLVDVSSER